MQNVFIGLFLLVGASVAQARTAGQVCSFIAAYSSSNGAACVSLLSQGEIQDAAADVCYQVATSSSSNGVTCLQNAVGKQIDSKAAAVCSFIAAYSSSNGANCISAIADKTYLADETNVCMQVANSSSSNGVRCLTNSGRSIYTRTCPTGPEIQEHIRAAQQELRRNRNWRADRILSDLMFSLDGCR